MKKEKEQGLTAFLKALKRMQDVAKGVKKPTALEQATVNNAMRCRVEIKGTTGNVSFENVLTGEPIQKDVFFQAFNSSRARILINEREVPFS